VTFVHRRSEGDEPVAASPLVERIALARGRGGQPGPRVRVATLPSRAVSPVPVARPAPAAPADLPTRLSASRIEALRDCPYRFFARAVLDLREVDELETPADKREYGNWLHAVLHRFHATRDRAADDVAALHAAADAVSAEAAIAPARLLPYRAGFEDLVPRYVAWLHARDAQGSTWSEGELEAERVLPELGGVVLEGRIDRLDTRADGGRELVDYKTGSVEGLKAKLRNRFEDTQLPAYALLVGADAADAAPTTAMYLALDDRKAPLELPHRQVVASAHALRQGLAQDLDRLRAGAAMAALGEGRTCESCEARGLCRRDHWSVAGAQPEAVAAPGPAS
jgi:ATP-dependent helicase/nuclease subunit B